MNSYFSFRGIYIYIFKKINLRSLTQINIDIDIRIDTPVMLVVVVFVVVN